MVTNRASGVAPLAVFFDATGTTAASVTSQPFHDLLYGWSFGDSGRSAGAWGQGTRAGVPNGRNSATGALAAHTYETSGSYPVTLTVSDGKGSVATASCTIVVDDPNAVYSGANTTCVSANGDFTGCPSGASQVSNYSGSVSTAISSYLSGGNKRLLFHAGQTFTQGYNNGGANLNVSGATIGSFPVGSSATINYTYSGSSIDAAIQLGGSANDTRIMDLAFTGASGTNSSAVSTEVYRPTKVTYLRLSASGFGGHVFSLYSADEAVIQDSTVTNISGATSNGGHGIILATSHTGALNKYQAALGNRVAPGSGANIAYCIRSELARYTVISDNTMVEGANQVFGTLKVAGWGDSNYSSDADVGKYIYISDNVHTAGPSAYGMIGTGPNIFGQDSRMRDYIIERDYFNGLPGNNSGGHPMVNIAAPYGTIRNNVFRAVNGYNQGGWPVYVHFVGQSGVTPATDHISIYNNTFYSNDTTNGGTTEGIRADSSVTLTARNNLFYFPNASSPNTIQNAGGATIIESYNTCGNGTSTSCAGSVVTDPQFTNGGGSLQLFTDYGIRSGSYAISAGTSVPVWLDAMGNAWSPTWDLGSMHH